MPLKWDGGFLKYFLNKRQRWLELANPQLDEISSSLSCVCMINFLAYSSFRRIISSWGVRPVFCLKKTSKDRRDIPNEVTSSEMVIVLPRPAERRLMENERIRSMSVFLVSVVVDSRSTTLLTPYVSVKFLGGI